MKADSHFKHIDIGLTSKTGPTLTSGIYLHVVCVSGQGESESGECWACGICSVMQHRIMGCLTEAEKQCRRCGRFCSDRSVGKYRGTFTLLVKH